jgi:hypothetical protein
MSASMSYEQKEDAVVSDMQAQQRWLEIMQPRAALLKFRLPYSHDPHAGSAYADGQIQLPIFGGQTTSETRLLVQQHDWIDWGQRTAQLRSKRYLHAAYGDALFYFQTRTRTTFFPHDVDAPGIDRCFDCAAEVQILTRMLRRVRAGTDDGVTATDVSELSASISDRISHNGTRSLQLDAP